MVNAQSEIVNEKSYVPKPEIWGIAEHSIGFWRSTEMEEVL